MELTSKLHVTSKLGQSSGGGRYLPQVLYWKEGPQVRWFGRAGRQTTSPQSWESNITVVVEDMQKNYYGEKSEKHRELLGEI